MLSALLEKRKETLALATGECGSMTGMSEPAQQPPCWIPNCKSLGTEKCEKCERDVCQFHMRMSGDDDLCMYCDKQKFK